MNETFSFGQISETVSLDNILILRQNKLGLKARFMENKFINPKLKQSETEKQIGCSSSTFQRYRNDINMLSPYGIPPNSRKRKKNISNCENDSERLQGIPK